MSATVDRAFGEKFLTSIDNFFDYGVDLLFNDWWEFAPPDAVEKYVEAIEQHPDLGPLAREAWLAPPFTLKSLEGYAPGTLGHAYLRFMIDNNLMEELSDGYRKRHEELVSSGRLDRMPAVMQYNVLRGFQTHDLHHVLTGYAAIPTSELALQAFELAQIAYPYAGMWIAVVTAHMTLLDPHIIKPAMDAITDGWRYGSEAKNIGFVKFENMLDRPLEEVQKEYGLRVGQVTAHDVPREDTPDMLQRYIA